ncbi:MAG: ABC transporter permease [Methanophagales archaeon]|nr:ABC transporter permease [Methanophagales archaeon]
MGVATDTHDVVRKGKKERWKKVKLKEVLSNPKFVGKTIRLGDRIFEVKGVMKE